MARPEDEETQEAIEQTRKRRKALRKPPGRSLSTEGEQQPEQPTGETQQGS